MIDAAPPPEPPAFRRGRIHAASRSPRSPAWRSTALVLGAWLVAAVPAFADYPDWEALADVEVIEVVTFDDDGDRRVKKVWFVLVDGIPYLRTNRSRWLDNLRRDPNLGLRIAGREYEAVAEEIFGDAIVEIVDRASAEKYGWQERVIHPFRLMRPDILRLGPRPEDERRNDPPPATGSEQRGKRRLLRDDAERGR